MKIVKDFLYIYSLNFKKYTNAEQVCKIIKGLLQRITTSKQLLLRIPVKN